MTAIPAVFMRGGTSKGVFFHAEHLPRDLTARNDMLLEVLGSPDPYLRQLDGMGGGISSLSKAAIIAKSERPDADIDYTFAQVAIGTASVDYSANCGNLSAAVGPFAVEEGLVSANDGETLVRIFNTNTGKMIHARFAVKNGVAVERGDLEIAGVAGAGAPIILSFLDPGGAATGALAPTGCVVERVEVGDQSVVASLVDAANPMAFVNAADFGLQGVETPDQLEASPGLMARLEALRATAASRMRLLEPDGKPQIVNPRVGMLAPPRAFRALDGREYGADAFDISIRMVSLGRIHLAVTVTGALCLAAACKLEGSVAHAIASGKTGAIRIGHPSGLVEVDAAIEMRNGAPFVKSTSLYRTARRLMQGQVLLRR